MNAKFLSILVLFSGLSTMSCANKSNQTDNKLQENTVNENQKEVKEIQIID